MSDGAHAVRVLGWAMLDRLRAQDESSRGICISPLSIATTLAMLAGAVSVDRRDEFCRKLGANSLSELADSFRTLDDVFAGKDHGRMVTMANVAFADDDVEFRPAYTQFLDSFGAYSIKFPSLQQADGEINSWVSDHTRGLIKDLVSRQVLKESHVVLINALAFKGSWQTKFNRKLTQKNTPFHAAGLEKRKVDMMFSHKRSIATAKGPCYTVVRLPYAATSPLTSMSLAAYLPDQGTSLEQLIQTMNHSQPASRFRTKKYDKFGFPKFDLDSNFSILHILQDLGFPVAGQLPEMAQGGNEVQKCIHRAVLKIDEEGTEAAAATAIILTRSLAPIPEILVFDRPFAFSICLDQTDMVVFTGLFFGR
ncbi:hypothetical protein QQX98_000951 [Neonectria punicea]|uniref:Serpin domain-containing protein n=1 Tax=Neonectria punicea TaxID=979145 RepID=A0ABR1HRA4_9HYPO